MHTIQRKENTTVPAESVGEPIRVLLIYPPVRLVKVARVPPLGLLYLGAMLEEAGIQVEVLDLNLLRLPIDEVMDLIESKEFDVVGIGGMTTVYYYVKLLTRLLKERYPDVPIIGGGSMGSATPETVVEHTGVDVVCIGEGESIIVELVRALVRGERVSDIAGIAFQNSDGEIVLTAPRPRFVGTLPYPAYHLVDMDTYIENNKVKYFESDLLAEMIDERGLDREKAVRPVFLFSKRGCPFGCTFCYRNFGRKVVYSDVDYVIEHMRFLEQEYNTAHFVFGDELFNVNRKWVIEFCEKVIEGGYKWVMATGNGLRANCTHIEDLHLMKQAGFYRVTVGIESFYDPTLKAMGKGQTAQHIFDAIRAVQSVGLELGSNMMLFGYEPDGWESMRENVRVSTELGRTSAGISIPCPYPGTYLYDLVRERGLISDEEGWLMELADRDVSDRVINVSKLTDQELFTIVQWGHDQLKINSFRPEYPILARVLDHVQPFLRQRFGIDAQGMLSKLKRGAITHGVRRKTDLVEEGLNIINERGTGGATEYGYEGDRYLLAEAFERLEKLPPPSDRATAVALH